MLIWCDNKMNDLALYTSTLSAFPSEMIEIYISARHSPCRLSISRVAKTRTRVTTLDNIETQYQHSPKNCSEVGCGWNSTVSIKVEEHWPSGYYELTLTDSKGNKSYHFLVVKSRHYKARAVIILATNTYHAYNYWGGYNSYANVDSIMQGMDLATAQTQAIGRLSTQRPFSQAIIHFPNPEVRLINARKRNFKEQPFVIDPSLASQTEFSPFDGSAGYINKWEHAFVSWAEERGIALDFLIDKDLEDHATCLNEYSTAIVVGHSEYWSSSQRNLIDTFVEQGGNLCVFSGNTCYWKVRWEDDGETLIAHKWNGEKNDPLWNNIATRKQATHLWSHPVFERSESQTIGLSFLYGGYHRLGNSVSKGQGGFTIYDEHHWALKDADLYYGDVIGDTIPLVGYESDGCPLQFNSYGEISLDPTSQFPSNLEIVATVPVVLGEPSHSPYIPTIPPEHLDVISNIKFKDNSKDNIDKARKGHAVIASFKKGKGTVFNTGTTEWVHGLTANDPHIAKITLNVLGKFGALGDGANTIEEINK